MEPATPNGGLYIVRSADFDAIEPGATKIGGTEFGLAGAVSRLRRYQRVFPDAALEAFALVPSDKDVWRIERWIQEHHRQARMNVDEFFTPSQLRDVTRTEWFRLPLASDWQTWLEFHITRALMDYWSMDPLPFS